MGTEQTPTSYDIPTGIESMDSEEAASTLRKIYSDCVTDESHPHNNPTHFMSKDFQAAISRLHEVKCGSEPETNEPTMLETAQTSEEWQKAYSADAFKQEHTAIDESSVAKNH